ncbi:MAG: 16S rRNA (cytidine(1402)-2'-O)-methyltransferase [Desulfurellaceae bacterium]|nr:16S rRNA (cytidine(1402)-2'-O)-methyltransferase [Desulfurellaceae bacterium]
MAPPSEATEPGRLYVVATPIGNLEDITLRALRVLKEVDLIAAEDTRRTRRLLVHYNISTPLTSYYDQIERKKAPALLDKLRAGQSIGLVSDAGTPGIADPGYRLVQGAWQAGVCVVPVPGPSMLTALLSIGGLPTDRCAFEGFLPAKQGQRRKALLRLQTETRTLVVFESPHRLAESLADMCDILGDRPAVIGRELTKRFEEVLRGRLSELQTRLHGRPIKGEVALLVAGCDEQQTPLDALALGHHIDQLAAEGLALKDIARILSQRHGLSRREVYALGVRMKKAENRAGEAS